MSLVERKWSDVIVALKLAFSNWMKKVPFGCSLRMSSTKRALSPLAHYPLGLDTVEEYIV
jgi:hypothetical protein